MCPSYTRFCYQFPVDALFQSKLVGLAKQKSPWKCSKLRNPSSMCGLQLWCIFRLENTDVFKTTTVNKLSTDLEGMEALIERLLALIDDVLVSTTMSMMFVLRVLLALSLFHSPVSFLLISFSFLFSGKSYVALTKKTGEIQMEFDPLLPFPKYHHQLLMISL